MTQEELEHLQKGDIVRHVGSDDTYIITGNYGGRCTAVRGVDITNALEWEKIDITER